MTSCFPHVYIARCGITYSSVTRWCLAASQVGIAADLRAAQDQRAGLQKGGVGSSMVFSPNRPPLLGAGAGRKTCVLQNNMVPNVSCNVQDAKIIKTINWYVVSCTLQDTIFVQIICRTFNFCVLQPNIRSLSGESARRKAGSGEETGGANGR